MSARSRASQWFGPRSASAPLQYKAPPQEPVSFINWDLGRGCDVAVLGEWQGVLHVLDRIERYDLTSNYEDTQMSDFKVGDVVRWRHVQKDRMVTPQGEGTVDYIDDDGLLHLAGDTKTTTWWPWRFELVSRPTKSALKVGDFEWLANKKPYVTATAASILGNNQTDPMRDPECTHGSDAMRYAGITKRLMENIWAKPTGFNPLPLPRDGWMPAGTHMPVKRELPRMAPLPRALLAPQNMRHKGDGFCSAIEALGIKKTNRLVCNQTRSWDPMDDTFLEDA